MCLYEGILEKFEWAMPDYTAGKKLSVKLKFEEW